MKKFHLRNGETIKVKRGCYTVKDIEKVSFSRFDPRMNKILGISKEMYTEILLSKKYFHLKSTTCQPQITYLTVSQVTYCTLGTLIKTYHSVILFTLSQKLFSIKS